MFYAVDAATGYIANYALRRKSDAVAVFRRCIVDLAHKTGTSMRSVRGNCDSLWTSNDFRDFCSTMGIAVQRSTPGAQQYNRVVKNAIQRCNKIAMASRRAAERRLGPGGFSCVRGLDARGDKLWAESAKDAALKLNQAASHSNPGRASLQELFTGKKVAFLMVPFFQYGFMYREGRSKLDDKAVPCYFLNAGDNHADCCVMVLRADPGHTCYSSNVTWALLPPSRGRGFSTAPPAIAPPTPLEVSFEIALTPPAVAGTHPAANAMPPPATAGTLSAAATWPPPPLLSSTPPSAHSPSADTSQPRVPTGMPPATAGAPPAHSPRAHILRSSPPVTADTLSAAATWPPPPLLSSSPPSTHLPRAHTSQPPGSTGMPPATADPPPTHSPSAHTPRSAPPSLGAARHCRYAVCSSYLAATTAAVVVTTVRALT